MEDCLFCKIIHGGDFSSTKVYEDDTVSAFRDINPQAPTHAPVIPKKHVASLAEADKLSAEEFGGLPARLCKGGGAGGTDGKRLPRGVQLR